MQCSGGEGLAISMPYHYNEPTTHPSKPCRFCHLPSKRKACFVAFILLVFALYHIRFKISILFDKVFKNSV